MSGSTYGSQNTCGSVWECVSMKPGVTTAPDASISHAPSTARPAPTSTIASPRTRTSARRAGAPVPSITSPPRIRISSSAIARFYHPGRRRSSALVSGGDADRLAEQQDRLGDAGVGDRVPDVLGRLLGGEEVALTHGLGDAGDAGVGLLRERGVAARGRRVDEAGTDRAH